MARATQSASARSTRVPGAPPRARNVEGGGARGGGGQPSRPGVTGSALDGVDRWLALGLGLADLLTDFSRNTLETAAGPTPRSDSENLSTADLVGVLPGALAGLGLMVQQRAFDVISEAEAVLGSQLTRVGAVRLTSPLARKLHSVLSRLDQQYRADQQARVAVAEVFLAKAGPETLDALLARIDVEAVIDRVDLDSVVQRVDLDAVLERVDVDRVVSKVDVNNFVSDVVNDLEVAGLLRDGTGALATSTVGALRSQVGGVANRITGRQSRE